MTNAPAEQILYTATTHAVGGAAARIRSTDGALGIETSPPGHGKGTNPEQLLAAGWSSCMLLSIDLVCRRMNVSMPVDSTIDADIDLCNTEGNYDGRFFIQARLAIHLPGLDKDLAQKIVESAHATCPYAEATRGNVDVTLTIV
ncbi:Ohr family peroxiredoxin [Rhodococcus sp. MEB064]|uniref:Ohr family peroxiredoxin n=1 Tax=Rhodococcus sp. MEB064 TaxID=1587522 RepID=UPI0005ABCC76|nr:Ohr family peroxiredoxin [Rhodococcus sp. MEB064]KIQ08029.1 peroxiredoxin [Rhodococcus sp. MEB064]